MAAVVEAVAAAGAGNRPTLTTNVETGGSEKSGPLFLCCLQATRRQGETMRMVATHRGYTSVLFLAWAAMASAQQPDTPAGQLDQQRLLSADNAPEGWFTTGRDFGKSHFSPLSQIDRSSVSRLGFAWQYETHTNRGLEATPIVIDSVMYTS